MDKNRFTLVCLLLLVLLVAPAVMAQASASYNLWWNLIGGGGGQSAAPAYKVSGSLGQALAGEASSASYHLTAGFWFPATGTALQPALYLPLVKK